MVICSNTSIYILAQERIEELEAMAQKLKKELKKRKDIEGGLNTELEEMRQDLGISLPPVITVVFYLKNRGLSNIHLIFKYWLLLKI